MRKQREEAAKTKRSVGGLFPGVLLGVAAALVSILLLVLLLAGLILGGVLPVNSPSFLLSVCAAIGAFLGSRVSIGKGSQSPMVTGAVTAALLCLVMILICICGRGEVAFCTSFAGTLLMVLAGGCLAGLFGRKKKRRKKK